MGKMVGEKERNKKREKKTHGKGRKWKKGKYKEVKRKKT